jgi:DNA excision repair protein ERCC-4
MSARKILDPKDIVAIVDTREQRPLDLSPIRTERGTLTTGDYTVKGLEREIAIERKSLPDMLGCVGRERERFEREVKRLIAYPVRALVIEATWHELEAGHWRSGVTSQAALGSVFGWIAHGLPVIMAGGRDQAAKYISRLLFIAARRRWFELQSFYKSLKIAGRDDHQPISESEVFNDVNLRRESEARLVESVYAETKNLHPPRQDRRNLYDRHEKR